MLTRATPVVPPGAGGCPPDKGGVSRSGLRTAATPTMAQSRARRLNFWNDQRAPGAFGKRISVSISSGRSAVSRNPVKNPAAGMVRSPAGPRATKLPPRARTTAGMSDAGSPWAIDPPMVPRWRTWGSPMSPATWATIGSSAWSRPSVCSAR